jgi:hypothetical protein
MKLNKAILAIFAFSLLMTALNTAGIFNAKMPVSDGMNVDETKITDLTVTDRDTGGSGFFEFIYAGAGFLSTSLKILSQIINSILNIDDVLNDYGVPSYLITMLYGMLILITVLGLMKLILGRGDKVIE